MSTTKPSFCVSFAFPLVGSPKPSSPEEMQAQYAAWTGLDGEVQGGAHPRRWPLKPAGARRPRRQCDRRPYIEAKEVSASYALIETDSLARATEIIKECPISSDPDYSVEIRELGY